MSDPVRAEQLRHKITIQRPDAAADSYGQTGEAWIDTVTGIRAFIDPTGGSEFYAAQKVHSEATANIWFRHSSAPDARPSMRVIFGTRTFNVLNVMNIQERNRWIRLICKEVD